jgi:putative transposase
MVSYNGPEFWRAKLPEGVEAGFIQPGQPWENGRAESFFDKLRDELLNREPFNTESGLQNSLDEYAEHYN